MASIITLLASSRSNGETAKLNKALAKELDAKIVDFNDHVISYYDYEHRNKDDDFLAIVKQFLQHDVIGFASPVYWYTMSAQMKVFFDRLSDLLTIEKDLGRQLRGKKTFIVATASNETCPEPYEKVFTETFSYLGMEYLGMLYADSTEGIKPEVLSEQIQQFSQKIKNAVEK